MRLARQRPYPAQYQFVSVPNGIEFSPKAEGPTCVFGFFEVVPGAGLGEGTGNRRGTQMNADEF
jgi:hypothetical protein